MLALLIFSGLQAAGNGTLVEPVSARLANEKPIFSFQDYPPEALRRNEHGLVSVLLSISPDGKMTSCDVTETSGSALLDTTTCDVIKARARFDSAKDSSGSAITGQYRMVTGWGVGEHQPNASTALTLDVAALPASYRNPADVQLVFDASGQATECNVRITSGSSAVDEAACKYAKGFKLAAPKAASPDVAPSAVRYVVVSLASKTSQ